MRRQVPIAMVGLSLLACVVFIAGPLVFAFVVPNLSVRLVPTKESIVLTGSQTLMPDDTISLFARSIAGIQYAWDPDSVQTMPDRLMVFLAPKIQQSFRDAYRPQIEDAKRYRRINFAKPIAIKVFHIDGNETAARVSVAVDIAVFVHDPVGNQRKFTRFDTLVATYFVVQRPANQQNQFGLVIEDIKEEDQETYQKSREKFW